MRRNVSDVRCRKGSGCGEQVSEKQRRNLEQEAERIANRMAEERALRASRVVLNFMASLGFV